MIEGVNIAAGIVDWFSRQRNQSLGSEKVPLPVIRHDARHSGPSPVDFVVTAPPHLLP
jgi:hypothetical protein